MQNSALPTTSIIYRRETQEFFTEDAEKTLCFSVGISSGCSLRPPDYERYVRAGLKMSSSKNFLTPKN